MNVQIMKVVDNMYVIWKINRLPGIEPPIAFELMK